MEEKDGATAVAIHADLSRIDRFDFVLFASPGLITDLQVLPAT